MLYIENNCHDPHYNLAFEEYVLQNLCEEEPILLLWQNEPSIIIGKYQNTVEEVNTDYVEKHGIHVVRRITGGGAVYHDLGNLNYSFIVPEAKQEIDFTTFLKPLIKALGELGIRSEQTGRNDVTIDDKKFSGNAQYHNKKGLLHHGTILFDSKLGAVGDALLVKEGKIASKGIKSVRSRVTNVRPYLKDDMDVESFKAFLLKEFIGGADAKRLELTEQQRKEVELLAEEKYKTWQWNYGKSPKCNIERERYFSGGYVKIMLDVKEGVIESMKVYGDFFGHKEIGDFEAAFVGTKYEKQSVSETLKGLPVEEFFHNITREDLEELIY